MVVGAPTAAALVVGSAIAMVGASPLVIEQTKPTHLGGGCSQRLAISPPGSIRFTTSIDAMFADWM